MSNPAEKTVTTPTAEPVESNATARMDGPSGGSGNTSPEVSPEREVAAHRADPGMAPQPPSEMTTTQAAEFLDVPRPLILKLLRRRELPSRVVGKHRRIPNAALLEYREKLFQQAKKAADEMAQTSQGLGLYGPEKPPTKAQ